MSLTRLPLLRATIPKVLLSDTFNRADSALTLGNAETGQAWTAEVGTWGVSSGQAYSASDAGGDRVSADVGTQNIDASLDVVGQVNTNLRFHELLFMSSGAGAYWRFRLINSFAEILKFDGATQTSVASIAHTSTDDVVYRLRIVQRDDCIVASVNGVTVLGYTLSAAEQAAYTGTRVGIRLGKSGAPSSAARGDNLLVRAS